MYIAMVMFLGPDSNGRQSPPMSGYHPQVAVGGVYTSCAIESLDNEATFEFDKEHLVWLRLLFAEEYPQAFSVGDTVRFYEGHHLVGSGTILEAEQC